MRESRTLILFCLLLTCYPICNADYSLSIVLKPRYEPETKPPYQWCSLAPDKMISMTLTPRDLLGNQNDNLKLCGLDNAVDNERLLSEWNSVYIFQFLDKTKESNAAYQTQVFEIPLSSMTPKANTQDEKVVGLYSLFLAPPGTVCNSDALQSAAGGAAGFYAIFIGVSDDFSEQKRRFQSDQICLEKAYDNKRPVLCGTKQMMGTERANSRLKTLLNIFNFPINADRQLKPNMIKQCKTVEATIESIKKSTYFDTKLIVSFRESKHQVSESDGFVKANIQRSEKSRKGLAHLKTSFPKTKNAANDKDITPYDGPVTFEKNSDVAEVFIGLKMDEDEEQDEIFNIKVEPFESLAELKRRKRAPKKKGTKGKEPSAPSNVCPGVDSKITKTEVVIKKHSSKPDEAAFKTFIEDNDWENVGLDCPKTLIDLEEPMGFLYWKKTKEIPKSKLDLFHMLVSEYSTTAFKVYEEQTFDMYIDNNKVFEKLNRDQKKEIFEKIVVMKTTYLQCCLVENPDPLPKRFTGGNVYRIEMGRVKEDQVTEYHKGDIIDGGMEGNFVSTSKDGFLTEDELNTDGADIRMYTVRFIIQNPTKGTDIQKFVQTDMKNQREVLFPIGTQFKVVAEPTKEEYENNSGEKYQVTLVKVVDDWNDNEEKVEMTDDKKKLDKLKGRKKEKGGTKSL